MAGLRRVWHAEVLSIGDELLHGEITDTNAAYLARRLFGLGFAVAHLRTVGDESAGIVAAFRQALERSDVVLATGGLGPTEDDLTLEALAKALGVPLVFHPQVMRQMAQRLKRKVNQLPHANRKQAFLPRGAHVLRNEWGTAPGVRYTQPAQAGRPPRHVFLMPGVPSEMEGLFETWIAPFLAEHCPPREVVRLKYYHSLGIPESVIGQRIRDLMQPGRNPDVGTRVGGGVVSVRLIARGRTAGDAEARLAPACARVRRAMGDRRFGEDGETIASAAAKELLKRGRTVALAESCTAGLVTATLARVPGISPALVEAAVTYSNDAKVRVCGVRRATLAEYGAVSVEVAREMAEGIRRRAKTDIGVSVTGIAGPTGATAAKPVGLVYIGVATPQVTRVVEMVMRGLDRNVFRERATSHALFHLRRAARSLR